MEELTHLKYRMSAGTVRVIEVRIVYIICLKMAASLYFVIILHSETFY